MHLFRYLVPSLKLTAKRSENRQNGPQKEAGSSSSSIHFKGRLLVSFREGAQNFGHVKTGFRRVHRGLAVDANSKRETRANAHKLG